jgi:hypothetical protein
MCLCGCCSSSHVCLQGHLLLDLLQQHLLLQPLHDALLQLNGSGSGGCGCRVLLLLVVAVEAHQGCCGSRGGGRANDALWGAGGDAAAAILAARHVARQGLALDLVLQVLQLRGQLLEAQRGHLKNSNSTGSQNCMRTLLPKHTSAAALTPSPRQAL